MSDKYRVFHNHTLEIHRLQAKIDLLAFDGEEGLSRPFLYTLEFTSDARDIGVEEVLNKHAWFSLYGPPEDSYSGLRVIEHKPARTLYGIITGFQRLSESAELTRYSVTLEPRLALAGRGKQYRIYQDQSVPEIVKSILLSRHDMEHFDCPFRLVHEYPRREQVMQYNESDLDFIHRLLAEVGIWYRIASHPTVRRDVVEFHDEQKGYEFGIKLPYHPLTGQSNDKDRLWHLQARHQVVEKHITFRSYNPLDARAYLDGDVNQVRNDKTTYGEAFNYAEPYRELGNTLYQFESLARESGYHFARLRHERYLNQRTRLSGTSNCLSLAPGQVLETSELAPQAFNKRAVITHLRTHAARNSAFIAHFDAMPYDAFICFRPPIPSKPKIAGTIPARISSNVARDTYAEMDRHGYYRVKFLFDRDTWPQGRESRWLRLARPYAGDTYGLHLPLIDGTEVAIAFEEGDPDRPYIAHALHDSERPDLVTDRRRDHTRNVLRTPANNKLRMEDNRGQEHVKLSTEYGGKSQLNLGHLVDAKKQKRGEGVELRTDDWGVIRAGKGVLISADKQTKAIGDVLSMEPATDAIQSARQQLAECREIAQAHHSQTPDIGGLQQLQTDAKDLHGAAILLSAPKGIGAVTPASLLLKSGDALYVQSADDINLAAAQRLSVHANQGMSLLAQQEGMRLVSGKGPLQIESHGDLLDLIAQQDLTLQSAQGHVQVTAKNGITLGCGGAYIRITPAGEIQLHSPGLISMNGQHRFSPPSGAGFPLPELPSSVCKECLRKARAQAEGFTGREARG